MEQANHGDGTNPSRILKPIGVGEASHWARGRVIACAVAHRANRIVDVLVRGRVNDTRALVASRHTVRSARKLFS